MSENNDIHENAMPIPENTPELPIVNVDHPENWLLKKFALLWVVFFAWMILGLIPGFQSDLGYWLTWARDLSDNGFTKITFNQPPIYVYYLYIVGKIYSLFHWPLLRDLPFKYICFLPAMVAHIALVWFYLKTKESEKDYKLGLVSWLVVLNPAILINGPIWGQVDLLACMPIVFALVYFIQQKKLFWLPSLFVVAIMIKFQAIFFLPLIIGLGLKKPKSILAGVMPALVIVIVMSMPFFINGNFKEYFKLAYHDPQAAPSLAGYNAANFWHVIVEPAQTVDQTIGNDGAFKVKSVANFFLLVISILGIAGAMLVKKSSSIWGLASMSAVAFFFFAPAMHERYLLFAVPFLCMWAATRPHVGLILAIISGMAFLNMNIVLNMNGAEFWTVTSLLTGFTLVLMIKEFFPNWYPHWLDPWTDKLINPKWNFMSMGGLFVVVMLFSVSSYHNFEDEESGCHSIAKDMIIDKYQDWGELQFNASVDKNPITIGGKSYLTGFGTHAASRVNIKIPEGVKTFRSFYGIDDEVGEDGGKVKFALLLDDQMGWQSEEITGASQVAEVTLNVSGKTKLTLLVDSYGDNQRDHADWAQACFE